MKSIIQASLFGILPFLNLTACGSKIDDVKSEYTSGNVATEFANGITTAEISADATTDQVMVASSSSAVADTAVTFPPGSLAVNTTVAIGVATDQSTAILNENGISAAAMTSTPVYIGPSSGTPTGVQQSLTIQLPLPVDKLNTSGASLLDGESSKLVILYSIYKDGIWKSGVIPIVSSTLVGTLARFQVEGLGYFQIVNLLETSIKKEKEGASSVQAALSPDQQVSTDTSTGDEGTGEISSYQGFYSGTVTEVVNASIGSYGNGKYCSLASDNFKFTLSKYNILVFKVSTPIAANADSAFDGDHLNFPEALSSATVDVSEDFYPSGAAITDGGIYGTSGIKYSPSDAQSSKILKYSLAGNFKGVTSKTFEGTFTVEVGGTKVCEYELALSGQ